MSIVRYDATDQERPWVGVMGPALELAKAVANTDFVPVPYRGKPAEITAAIMYGDEIGIGPLQALAKIAVIQGRPTLAAETIRALVLAAGHDIWIEEATVTRVTVGGRRKNSDRSQLFTWTLDDAKRAGIAGKQSWRQYPRQMLLARASAELARAVFADVIGGLAASEEAEDIDQRFENGEPPPAEPEAPKTSSRRRRRTSAAGPVIAPSPSAPPAPPLPPLPEEEPPKFEPATEPQMRKLFASLRDHGLEDRDTRMAWINQRLERTIESTSELSDIEAAGLIHALDAEPLPDTPQPPQEAQLPLGEQPVSRETLDILAHFRREADVSEQWLRDALLDLGLEDVPEKITRAVIARLTRQQARQLTEMLNAEIDKRQEQ